MRGRSTISLSSNTIGNMSNTSYAGSDFSVRLIKEEAGLSLHLRYSNRIGIDSNNKTFQQCNQFKHDLMDLSKVTPLAATQLMFSSEVFLQTSMFYVLMSLHCFVNLWLCE